MQIILAKTAGFCFGVNRAVKLTYELLEQGRPVATLGPLIHNPQVVEDLESKGAITCDSVDDVPDGCEVVIRSHGVGQSVYDKISTRRLVYHDATCPFVTKIHKIAARAGAEGAMLLVAGDAKHPEVQGIVGHTSGPVQVFANPEELQKLLPTLLQQESIYVVAQTTFRVESWENCKGFLKKECTKAKIFDTICNATWARQQEAEDLSQKCDHMVVIGGHHSSNTQKLLQVAARHTKAINVETADELDKDWLNGARIVGVTAGASTPSSIIEEVLNSMSEIRDDMSFEEMLAASEAKPLYAGKIVKAKVISVSPTECIVGVDGSKHTGIVPLREMSHDPNAKMEDLVKVDDELDLVVVKTNDQEGVDTLSRVRFEAQKGMKDVSEAAENGTVMEGDVMEANKGGVVVNVKGVRVFVPRSQATMRRDEDYTKLVGQHVKLVITECAGRKIVGSINKVTAEENKAKRDEFWKNVEVDKQYTGVVKSLTSYGAFVDIGGVDGLIHVTDLAWHRVKHPSEVVTPGQEVTVKIIGVDKEKERIQLSLKALQPQPWDVAEEKYPEGSIVEGKVVRITTFGAFVELEPGLDGLVHISQCALKRIAKVEDAVQVGQTVRVKVLKVDKEAKRISLSIREALTEEVDYNAEVQGLDFDDLGDAPADDAE